MIKIETCDPTPYDFARDEDGAVSWYEPTKVYCERYRISLDSRSEASLLNFADAVLQRFQHFVEQEEGWRLLWRGSRRKNEPAARNLLLGIAMHYCRATGVAISSLPLIGKDVITISTAEGISVPVLLELKLAINRRFWNTLHKGSPSYGKAEKARLSRFVVVTFSDADEDRYKEIIEIVEKLHVKYNCKLYHVDSSSDDVIAVASPAMYQFVACEGGVIQVDDHSTERPPAGSRWVRQSAESPTGVRASSRRRSALSKASPLRRPPSSSASDTAQAQPNALEVVAWKARVFRSQNETIICSNSKIAMDKSSGI